MHKHRVRHACLWANILLLCTQAQAFKKDLIKKIWVTPQSIRYELNEELHKKYMLKDLFITYHDPEVDLTQLDYTIATMPLLLNIFSIILISGELYYIDAIDKDLYHSLHIVEEALKRLYPHTTWSGRLIARNIVDNSKTFQPNPLSAHVAMPFSHGLDSICTSLRHRQMPQLLMTVRGCPDTPLDSWDKNWHVTKQAVTHFAHVHGHTTSFVDSNFHEFFNWNVLSVINPEIMNWRMDTIEDLGWIGIAAPIMVTKGIPTLLLAANKDWSTNHPGISSPITNDTMKFAGVSVFNDAFELSRTEKNFVVAQICNEHNLEKPITFVCEHNKKNRKNCCYCTKCVFTILSWILAHEDPRSYGFDVNVYAFLDRFKNVFFHENVYSPYRTGCIKYMQLKAQEQIPHIQDEKVYEFFSWFITINFDKLTVRTPQITVDYDNFKDLCPTIPTHWKDFRIALETLHIHESMTDAEYQTIWNTTQATKGTLRKQPKKRMIRKRS